MQNEIKETSEIDISILDKDFFVAILNSILAEKKSKGDKNELHKNKSI